MLPFTRLVPASPPSSRAGDRSSVGVHDQYALGRGLQDGNQCTVQRLVEAVSKNDDRARTLIREIVLVIPFHNVSFR